MSRVLLFFTCLVLAVIATVVVAAGSKFPGHPSSPKPSIEYIDLKNGKTLTKIRQRRSHSLMMSNQKQQTIGEPTIPVPTVSPTPSFVQPKRMIFVLSSYCNSSLLQLTGNAVTNGGWLVPPPATMPSFFQGEYTGFEVASNPGQTVPTFNGTFSYAMNDGNPVDSVSAAFFAGLDEFGMDVEWATRFHPMLYASEYSDIAVYNLVLGDSHFTDKPIC